MYLLHTFRMRPMMMPEDLTGAIVRWFHALWTSHRQMVESSQQLMIVDPSADTAVCRVCNAKHNC